MDGGGGDDERRPVVAGEQGAAVAEGDGHPGGPPPRRQERGPGRHRGVAVAGDVRHQAGGLGRGSGWRGGRRPPARARSGAGPTPPGAGTCGRRARPARRRRPRPPPVVGDEDGVAALQEVGGTLVAAAGERADGAAEPPVEAQQGLAGGPDADHRVRAVPRSSRS